jgi:hypothetical protein
VLLATILLLVAGVALASGPVGPLGHGPGYGYGPYGGGLGDGWGDGDVTDALDPANTTQQVEVSRPEEAYLDSGSEPQDPGSGRGYGYGYPGPHKP